MDTRYLEYILVLAETGNMTRASKKLYISQPTLSQFLSKQEQEIGAPLFQRTGGIYTLTPVGELYAEYARRVLSLTDILEKDIKRIATTSQIRIGTSASSALQMLSSILVDFRKYYPNVELLLSDGNLRSMGTAISKGDMDIAFLTANSMDQYKGQCIELKKEEVVLAAPAAHPFCQKTADGTAHVLTSQQLLSAFRNFPFILQHKGSCIRYLVDDFFDEEDFNPIVACSTNNARSICDMVSSNIGIGFIPASYASPCPQITYFTLEPKLFRIHVILYRKDLVLEPPHKYLIELASRYAEENWGFLPNP
ncbi:MAG: LysR family transcriptional regulator [Lachnospiraceae bacterium]|nr:LysR family transcriptional regulator [Lachnospiraceae bacterium]